MSISHRTNRLKLAGQPSVEQLQNGRYRLTVTCSTINSREDWYSANKDRIFPDFGSLQSAEMSIDGLAPREGEAYTDMRLTKVESGNRSGMGAVGDYNVELTYETLGSAFVQVKDDTTDYELNGLRRVTRTSIAEAGTDYTKTVGTSFIDHQINNETAVRCYLASYSVDDTDSFRQVQEVYVEAGTLSETLDNVGSQKAKVIETIGADPVTPDGYLLASKKESDFEGFQTNQFTFLKPSILSRNIDTRNQGNLKIETVESFDLDPTSTINGVLISEKVSDVEGIPTNQNVYAEGSGEVSRTIETRNNGALTITTVESLGEAGNADGIEIEETTREQDGYTLFRNIFADGDGEVSRTTEKRNQGKLTVTTVEALGSAGTATGVEIEATTREQDGYTLFRNVFANGTGEVSRTVETRNQGKLTITTVEALGSAGSAIGVEIESTTREQDGYTLFRNVFADGQGEVSRTVEKRIENVLTITTVEALGSAGSATGIEIEATTREQDGYTLFRNVFADGKGEISRSEDNVGSQLAITTEVFNPESDPIEDGYSIARIEFSNVSGIPTKRFTFLKNDVELSRSEDKVGSQLAIVTEVFNPESDPQEDGYSLARIEVSDVDGIPTKRYTFLKDDVELARSEDLVGSQKAIVTEVFKPEADPQEDGYSVARTEVSDVDGIPTKRFTFLKDNVKLSETEDRVGSQLAKVEEWFNPTDDPVIDLYVIANIQVSDFGGIPTKRFTFLKENVELSRNEDLVGSQLSITTEVFKPESDPEEPDYSVARKEESDVEGIPTKRFTLLKNDAELSRSKDLLGSQLAIVTEVFNPEIDPTEDNYSLARTDISDVDGIPTKRYTFLKDNVEISRSEDKVGSQLAITTEVFNPEADPEESGYSVARIEESDVEGIPTKRFTLLKDNAELSRSEDLVGSQLAIVTEIFKPEADPEEPDYSVARIEFSDVDGIPTKRFTLLKDNVELSRSEDKVGSQLAITTEVFNPEVDPEEPDYIIARKEESDVDGIPTKRFTFLKEDVELFHTEDIEGGLNEIVEEWFKPTEREDKPEYVLIEKTQSDLGGIPTERYTFWKEKGLIDESYVNESEGVIRTTQVFFSEVDDDLVKGPIVSKDTKNIDGIPTITVTTLQGANGISIIEGGERLANSYDQLVSFTYPGILDIANQPTGGFTSYSWRLSAPVQSLVTATTYVIFQDTNTISNSDFTYGGASGLWNPTEWAKGQSYGVGYSYRPFAESKGFRGYRADADVVQVTETVDNQFLINGNLLFEDTTGGLNVYGGPEDPNGKTYVLDVKITPAFVDIEGATSYKKVIIVANIPVQENTEPAPPTEEEVP